MIASYVWHWWIGAGLAVLGVLTVLGLGVGYLKQVTAMKHPTRAQRQAMRAAQAPSADTET